MPSITCIDCGETIDPAKDPGFCPACGSGNRHFVVQDQGVIKVCEGLEIERPGDKKPFMEIKTGEDLFRKTGQWNHLTRVFDRDNDRYLEHIEDSDGNVLRHTDERLSEHRGHGSAKYPSPKKGGKRQGNS